MPHEQKSFAPLSRAQSIDEVIRSIDKIIAWSTVESNRVGYFAALYRRITLAVQQAIAHNEFRDGALTEQFDAAFANRYFAALNGYFWPGEFDKPTEAWQVSLDAATQGAPIIVQHLLGACNAHIAFDLGITTHEIAGGNLAELRDDFDKIIMASQTSGVVKEVDKLSPVLAGMHEFLQNYEIDFINDSLKVLRDNAWEFAEKLSANSNDDNMIRRRDREMATLGEMIYHPGIPMAAIFNAVAEDEHRDVAQNIQVLATSPWLCGLLQSTCRELRELAAATVETALALIRMGNTSGKGN